MKNKVSTPVTGDIVSETIKQEIEIISGTVVDHSQDICTEQDVVDQEMDELTPPRVGDIVHFIPVGLNLNEPYYAAMVTKVWSPTCVNLIIFWAGEENTLRQSSVIHGDYCQESSHWLYK